MKIDFEHLGSIEQGSITLNDFTLFCGKNNSGKTYAMYSLYGLLDKEFDIRFDFVKKIMQQLKEKGTYQLNICDVILEQQNSMIKHIEQHFQAYLPRLFGVANNQFEKTRVNLDFDSEDLKCRAIKKAANFEFSLGKNKDWTLLIVKKENNYLVDLTLQNVEIPDSLLQQFISESLVSIIFTGLSKNSFLLPAERAGLNLFFKELSSTRNLLLQHAQKDNINPMELLKDIIESRYADPIQDYIQYLNTINTHKAKKSNYRNYAQAIQKTVLNGKYDVDKQGNVSFMPYRSNNAVLPLHYSSSTVKTFFGLVFYLEHLAKEGDCVMIDEPELNLHPDNQRQVARVLAQLVNAGLKVIVSTHSDYFIRELNNLIMLKKDFSGAKELQNKYGYQDNELLDGKQMSAYLFDNNKITPMPLDEDEGVIAETFDSVINNLNKSSNEIYYAMQDAKEQID